MMRFSLCAFILLVLISTLYAQSYTCFGKASTDPTVCSGSGLCFDNDDCVCYAGFKGKDCSAASCPAAFSWAGSYSAIPVATPTYSPTFSTDNTFSNAVITNMREVVMTTIAANLEIAGFAITNNQQYGFGVCSRRLVNAGGNCPINNLGDKYPNPLLMLQKSDETFISICYGRGHVAMLSNTSVVRWTIGLANLETYPDAKIEYLPGAVKVACAAQGTFIIFSNGTAAAYGWSGSGELSTGSTDNAVWTKVVLSEPTRRIKDIASTTDSSDTGVASCFITDGSENVFCAGSFRKEETSMAELIPVAIQMNFTQVEDPHVVQAVMTQENTLSQFTLFVLTRDGKLYVLGRVVNKALGYFAEKDFYFYFRPVQIDNTYPFVHISMSPLLFAALNNNDELYLWGDNSAHLITAGGMKTAAMDKVNSPTKITFSGYTGVTSAQVGANAVVALLGSRCTTCFGISSTNPTVCSGHGRCYSKDTCVNCKFPYTGEECEFNYSEQKAISLIRSPADTTSSTEAIPLRVTGKSFNFTISLQHTIRYTSQIIPRIYLAEYGTNSSFLTYAIGTQTDRLVYTLSSPTRKTIDAVLMYSYPKHGSYFISSNTIRTIFLDFKDLRHLNRSIYFHDDVTVYSEYPIDFDFSGYSQFLRCRLKNSTHTEDVTPIMNNVRNTNVVACSFPSKAAGYYNISIVYNNNFNEEFALTSNLQIRVYERQSISLTKQDAVYSKQISQIPLSHASGQALDSVDLSMLICRFDMTLNQSLTFVSKDASSTIFNCTVPATNYGYHNFSVVVGDPLFPDFELLLSTNQLQITAFDFTTIVHLESSVYYSNQQVNITIGRIGTDQRLEYLESNIRCKFLDGTLWPVKIDNQTITCSVSPYTRGITQISLEYFNLPFSYVLTLARSLPVTFFDFVAIAPITRTFYHSGFANQYTFEQSTNQSYVDPASLKCIISRNDSYSEVTATAFTASTPKNKVTCVLSQSSLTESGEYQIQLWYLFKDRDSSDISYNKMIRLSTNNFTVSLFDYKPTQITERSVYYSDTTVVVPVLHLTNQIIQAWLQSDIKCQLIPFTGNTQYIASTSLMQGQKNQYNCSIPAIPAGFYYLRLLLLNIDFGYALELSSTNITLGMYDFRSVELVDRSIYYSNQSNQVLLQHATNQTFATDSQNIKCLFNGVYFNTTFTNAPAGNRIACQINQEFSAEKYKLSLWYQDSQFVNFYLPISTNTLNVTLMDKRSTQFKDSSVYLADMPQQIVINHLTNQFIYSNQLLRLNNNTDVSGRINTATGLKCKIGNVFVEAALSGQGAYNEYTCLVQQGLPFGDYNLTVWFIDEEQPNRFQLELSSNKLFISFYERRAIHMQVRNIYYSKAAINFTMIHYSNQTFREDGGILSTPDASNIKCKFGTKIYDTSYSRNGSLNFFTCKVNEAHQAERYVLSLWYQDLQFPSYYLPLSSNTLNITLMDKASIALRDHSVYLSDIPQQIVIKHSANHTVYSKNLLLVDDQTALVGRNNTATGLKCKIGSKLFEAGIRYASTYNEYTCLLQKGDIPYGDYNISLFMVDDDHENQYQLELSNNLLFVSLYERRSISLKGRSVYYANSEIGVVILHSSNQTFREQRGMPLADEKNVKCLFGKKIYNTTLVRSPADAVGVNQFTCEINDNYSYNDYNVSLLYYDAAWSYYLELSEPSETVTVSLFEKQNITLPERSVFYAENNNSIVVAHQSTQTFGAATYSLYRCRVGNTLYRAYHLGGNVFSCDISPPLQAATKYNISLYVIDSKFTAFSLVLSNEIDFYLFPLKPMKVARSAFGTDAFAYQFTYNYTYPAVPRAKLMCFIDRNSNDSAEAIPVAGVPGDYTCNVAKRDAGVYSMSLWIHNVPYDYFQISSNDIRFAMIDNFTINYAAPFVFLTSQDTTRQHMVTLRTQSFPVDYSSLVRYECRYLDQRSTANITYWLNRTIDNGVVFERDFSCNITAQTSAKRVAIDLWLITEDALHTEYKLTPKPVTVVFTDQYSMVVASPYVDGLTVDQKVYHFELAYNVTYRAAVDSLIEQGLYCLAKISASNYVISKASFLSNPSFTVGGSSYVSCDVQFNWDSLETRTQTVNLSLIVDTRASSNSSFNPVSLAGSITDPVTWSRTSASSVLFLSSDDTFFTAIRLPLQFSMSSLFQLEHTNKTIATSYTVPGAYATKQHQYSVVVQAPTTTDTSATHALNCSFENGRAASCVMEQPITSTIPKAVPFAFRIRNTLLGIDNEYAFTPLYYAEYTKILKTVPYMMSFSEFAQNSLTVTVELDKQLNTTDYEFSCYWKGTKSSLSKDVVATAQNSERLSCQITSLGQHENATLSIAYRNPVTNSLVLFTYPIGSEATVDQSAVSLQFISPPAIRKSKGPIGGNTTIAVVLPPSPVKYSGSTTYDLSMKLRVRGRTYPMTACQSTNSDQLVQCKTPSNFSSSVLPVSAQVEVYVDNSRAIASLSSYQFYLEPIIDEVLPSNFFKYPLAQKVTLKGRNFVVPDAENPLEVIYLKDSVTLRTSCSVTSTEQIICDVPAGANQLSGAISMLLTFNGENWHRFDNILTVYEQQSTRVESINITHVDPLDRNPGKGGALIHGQNFANPPAGLLVRLYDSLIVYEGVAEFRDTQTLYIPPTSNVFIMDLWARDLAYPRSLTVTVSADQGQSWITNTTATVDVHPMIELKVSPLNFPVGFPFTLIVTQLGPNVFTLSADERIDYSLVSGSTVVALNCSYAADASNWANHDGVKCAGIIMEDAVYQLNVHLVNTNRGTRTRIYVATNDRITTFQPPRITSMTPTVLMGETKTTIKIIGSNFNTAAKSSDIKLRVSSAAPQQASLLDATVNTNDETLAADTVLVAESESAEVVSSTELLVTIQSNSVSTPSSISLELSFNAGANFETVFTPSNLRVVPAITLPSAFYNPALGASGLCYSKEDSYIEATGTNIQYFDLIKNQTSISFYKDSLFSRKYLPDELEMKPVSLPGGSYKLVWKAPEFATIYNASEVTFPLKFEMDISFGFSSPSRIYEARYTTKFKQSQIASIAPKIIERVKVGIVELTGEFFNLKSCLFSFDAAGTKQTLSTAIINTKDITANCSVPWGSIPTNTSKVTVQVANEDNDVSSGYDVFVHDPLQIVAFSPAGGPSVGDYPFYVQVVNALQGEKIFVRFNSYISQDGCTQVINPSSLDKELPPLVAGGGYFQCKVPPHESGFSIVSVSYTKLENDWYYSTTRFNCTGCSTGYFAEAFNKDCAPCPAGKIKTIPGVGTCNDCPANQYQDLQAQSSCKDCPDFSTTKNKTGSISIEACECIPGYMFNPNYVEGAQRCVPCATGADCVGMNTTIPTAIKGYWNSKNEPYTFYACYPTDSCIGGGPEKCAPGYEGVRCGSCRAGYYKLRSRCTACSEDVWLRFLLVVLFAGFLFAAFFGFSSIKVSHMSSLSIGFFIFQVVSMFSTFDVQWPAFIAQYFTVSSASNFNIDFFSPQCLVTGLTFQVKFILTLIIPPVFLAGFFLCYILVELRSFLAGVCCARFNKEGENRYLKPMLPPKDEKVMAKVPQQVHHHGTIQQRQTPLTKLAATVTRLAKNGVIFVRNFTIWFFTQKQSREEMMNFRNKLFNAFFTFISFSYIYMMTSSSELFVCTNQTTATKYTGGQVISTLNKSPNIVCFKDPEWWTMFPFSIAYFVVINGGAMCLFAYMFIMRKRITDPEQLYTFNQRFRFVLKKFKSQAFYFEAVITIRKLLLSILQIFLAPVWVVVFAIGIIFVSLIMHSIIIPFKRKFHNLIEYYSLIGTLLTLFFGLILFFKVSEEVRVVATVCAIFVIVASTLIIFGMIFFDIYIRVKKTGKKVKRRRKQVQQEFMARITPGLDASAPAPEPSTPAGETSATTSNMDQQTPQQPHHQPSMSSVSTVSITSPTSATPLDPAKINNNATSGQRKSQRGSQRGSRRGSNRVPSLMDLGYTYQETDLDQFDDQEDEYMFSLKFFHPDSSSSDEDSSKSIQEIIDKIYNTKRLQRKAFLVNRKAKRIGKKVLKKKGKKNKEVAPEESELENTSAAANQRQESISASMDFDASGVPPGQLAITIPQGGHVPAMLADPSSATTISSTRHLLPTASITSADFTPSTMMEEPASAVSTQ